MKLPDEEQYDGDNGVSAAEVRQAVGPWGRTDAERKLLLQDRLREGGSSLGFALAARESRETLLNKVCYVRT